MCSPEVAAAVRKVIAERGGPVDRRRLLAGGGAALLGGALAPMLAGAQGATPVATPQPAEPSTIYSSSVPISRIHDISHVAGPDFPVFVGAETMEIGPIASYDEEGYRKYRLTMDEHTGTHVDAPAHFIPEGATVDDLDPTAFVAPLS